MLGNFLIAFIFSLLLGASAHTFAQAQTESNARKSQATNRTATKQTTPRTPAKTRASNESTLKSEVNAAFNKLLDGIRKSNVNEVMSLYWESPQLIIFNNNGTVTKSYDQVRSNRESLYANATNVKLDVRDVKVQMLGAGGALVTCLWSQSQDYKGAPESSSGRLTVVFKQIGGAWKIVHTHTSPDAPDPSRLPPSERQTPNTEPTPTPAPNRTRPSRANPTPKPTPNPRVPTVKPTPSQ